MIEFIKEYENVSNICDETLQYIVDLNQWDECKIDGGKTHEARQSSQCVLKKLKPENKILHKKFLIDLQTMFGEYLQDYVSPYRKYLEVSKPEPFICLKYNVGNKYEPHSDGDTGHLNRRVSGLWYLNDDYKGGELYFPYFDLTIKPKKNSLILFPSNFCFVHSSLPITEGTKYAIVSWFK